MKQEILIGIFLVYLAVLLSQTMVPLWQCGFVNGNINFVPFKTIYTYMFGINYMVDWNAICQLNMLANIGLFLPFGFLLPFVKKKMNGRKIILGGMLTSLFIEIMQVFVDRSSDVDDLILNTLGTAIGYLGYKIFVKVLFHFNWLSIKKDVNEQKDFFV